MSGKRDPGGQDSQCKGSEAGVALAFVKSSEVAHVAGREGVRMSKGSEEARERGGDLGGRKTTQFTTQTRTVLRVNGGKMGSKNN